MIKFVTFTLVGTGTPDQPNHIAVQPQEVAAIVQMGNTDTTSLYLSLSTHVVMGTFDEVLKILQNA